MEEKQELTIEEIMEILNEVVFKLHFGVIENDEIRKFDMIDYYNITKVPLYSLLGIIRNKFSKEDCDMVEKFSKSSGSDIKISRNEFAKYVKDPSINYIVNAKFKLDKNGYERIKNTGREFTMEERIFCKNYLKENKIPYTYATYKAIRNRIAKGYVTVEKPRQYVK